MIRAMTYGSSCMFALSFHTAQVCRKPSRDLGYTVIALGIILQQRS
jgi:hypothetical protein